MPILRIVLVWLISLSFVSLLFGRIEGFLFVFLLYGLFATVPALVALAIASAIEGALVRRGRSIAALAVGPAGGFVIPALLVIVAPSKRNAMAAVDQINFIALSTGMVWALSYLWLSRASRSRPAKENGG